MEYSPELQRLLLPLVLGNPEDVESVWQPTGCSSICPHTSDVLLLLLLLLLNQAHRLACTWFLKINSVQSPVCVFVCVSVPEAVNN